MVVALWAVGCRLEEASTPPPDVLTEHRPQALESPESDVGGPCGKGGASQCNAGLLCLHVRPEPSRGYVCTRKCQSHADCPQGWACTLLDLSTEDQVCTPPEDAALP